VKKFDPCIVFDYDFEGKVLGIEMLDVSECMDNTREFSMELVGDQPLPARLRNSSP
jgi:uncharacterized protein YuzE